MIKVDKPTKYSRCIACNTQKNLKYFILGTKVKDGLTICNDCLKELSNYKDCEE
jgi:hypothetical protein